MGGPQYRPQNTILLIMGTPKKGSPNFGKPPNGIKSGSIFLTRSGMAVWGYLPLLAMDNWIPALSALLNTQNKPGTLCNSASLQVLFGGPCLLPLLALLLPATCLPWTKMPDPAHCPTNLFVFQPRRLFHMPVSLGLRVCRIRFRPVVKKLYLGRRLSIEGPGPKNRRLPRGDR